MALNSPLGHPTKWREQINCGCKVNLRLKVTARRQDKLHDLSSCFLFLPCPGDILTVSETPGGCLHVEVPGYPELDGEQNLLWKSALAYAEKSGLSPDWHLVLEKNVPIAAGLGGGSADAGALLALLNGHYQALGKSDLLELAFSIGADVPFFLERRTAWVAGAGEKLEFLENSPSLPEILIVNPGFPISAKWGYTHLDPALIGADDPAVKASWLKGEVNWREFCCNDLAPAAFRKFPLLEILAENLYASGALAVQMSGSGPSLFALFDSGSAEAALKMREKFASLAALRIFADGKEF